MSVPHRFDVLTVEEAARWGRVHPATIRKACRSGELRAAKRGPGGRWRLLRGDVADWLGLGRAVED